MRSINSTRSKDKDKMLLSSRAQPPKALKNFSQLPRSNLTVKQFLLSSPLPSPALPALLPRHGKKPPPFNTRRALRFLSWLAILVTLYSLVSYITKDATLPAMPYLSSSGKTYQIVADDELPEYPTPIGVVDSKGRKKWTISIPEKLGFPLSSVDYADICSHIPEVANHISSAPSDTTYLDVDSAQKAGLLPQPRHPLKSSLPICKTSLTYVLDATDASFGSALMGLWISYSLAERESRAFFIDDTQFAYGKYSSFFVPPTPPSCRPPPSSYRVPCPRQANHIIISAATFPYTFGKDFHSTHNTHEIYQLARHGYEALLHLPSADATYISQHLTTLRSTRSPNAVIGIHLRRGDRHPYTPTYSSSYLPPQHYLTAASDLARTHFPHTTTHTTHLATDDPELYHTLSLPRAQSLITLASRSTLQPGEIGWEGGFFASLFFNLGIPQEAGWQKRIGSPLPSRMVAEMGEEERDERDWRTEPTHEMRRLRGLIGRAYLLDLAVLGKGDGVVCGVSSATCRVLGVMLGKEAVEEGRWWNVDGEQGWAGWRAFGV